MKEFDIIDDYFYNLVSKKEALDLKDDCAVFKSNKQIIVNVDTIIENEHFFSSDPSSSIATKLLNVNLSDIASMGGTPKYWTMSISFPKNRLINSDWLKDFCGTIEKIQTKHNFYLISGDTTFTSGNLSITANLFGELDVNKKVLKKSTAKVGDVICVSGFIGDAYWGLQKLLNKIDLKITSKQDESYLIHRYQYPEARIELGKILVDYANSCTDISDGLWADIEKMCKFSKVLGVIDGNSIPISNSVKNITEIDETKKLINSICGGDDYELAFTISKEKLNDLQKVLAQKNIFIKQIGYIKEVQKDNKYIQIFYNNKEISTSKTGYNY